MSKTFITIEGDSGSGKSAVIEIVSKLLSNNGIENITTSLYTSTETSKRISSIIKLKDRTIDNLSESLLYCTCLNETLRKVIVPALEEDKVVICERYVDSAFVYGNAKETDFEQIMALNTLLIKNYMPDLTIFLEASPEKCLARKKAKGSKSADLEKLQYHLKIHDCYKNINKLFKNRIVTINADQPLEDLANEVYETIDLFLRSNKNEGIF